MKPEDRQRTAAAESAVQPVPSPVVKRRQSTASRPRPPRRPKARPDRPVRLGVAVLLVLAGLVATFLPAAMLANNARLECSPRTFQVVPGEPIRLECTVRADTAAPIRLHVPGDPLLKLRALERPPVRRSPEGEILHNRVVIWQGLEPGTVKMKDLSVETAGRKLSFPEISITIVDPGS